MYHKVQVGNPPRPPGRARMAGGLFIGASTMCCLFALMNSAPAELLHLLVDAALQLSVRLKTTARADFGPAMLVVRNVRLRFSDQTRPARYVLKRTSSPKKTPARMPAFLSFCRKANSFFEEYAALPRVAGRVCVVKKVGVGRVLSINWGCRLSCCLPVSDRRRLQLLSSEAHLPAFLHDGRCCTGRRQICCGRCAGITPS